MLRRIAALSRRCAKALTGLSFSHARSDTANLDISQCLTRYVLGCLGVDFPVSCQASIALVFCLGGTFFVGVLVIPVACLSLLRSLWLKLPARSPVLILSVFKTVWTAFADHFLPLVLRRHVRASGRRPGTAVSGLAIPFPAISEPSRGRLRRSRSPARCLHRRHAQASHKTGD